MEILSHFEYVRCSILIAGLEGMPWPRTGGTYFHEQLVLFKKIVQLKS